VFEYAAAPGVCSDDCDCSDCDCDHCDCDCVEYADEPGEAGEHARRRSVGLPPPPSALRGPSALRKLRKPSNSDRGEALPPDRGEALPPEPSEPLYPHLLESRLGVDAGSLSL
jgi:hypothetical protein